MRAIKTLTLVADVNGRRRCCGNADNTPSGAARLRQAAELLRQKHGIKAHILAH
jgi:hypothetical protein